MTRPLLLLLASAVLASAAETPAPKFQAVTIDAAIQIGYGLAIADVDGDKWPDILLADKKQFVWYRNPGPAKAADAGAWAKHVLAENLTEHDNVCLAAQDLDGDGRCEIAVGAEWNPGDTEKSGAVFYLQPPADRTQPWEAIRLRDVPTVHRVRWFQPAPGQWRLAMLPLHGRGNKNGQGETPRLLMYERPADVRTPWPTEEIPMAGNMTHNFDLQPLPEGGGQRLLIASKQNLAAFARSEAKLGLQETLVSPAAAAGSPRIVAEDFPGAGEIRAGHLGGPGRHSFVATVEPMHGQQLAVYLPPGPGKAARRQVLTDRLVEGHALAARDLLGTGSDQLVVGWRGQGGGISLWIPQDPQGDEWRENSIDAAGMACEDLQVADLNGDGALDIVASGRATKNVKLYLNLLPAAK